MIVVDPEFASLCPPLTPEEYGGLEDSIRAEGCRDALIVWPCGDDLLILDGHNRYAICERLGLPYRTTAMALPDRDAAVAWIIANQLARRNLHPDAASILRGRLYNMRKATPGGTGANQYSEQRDHFDPAARTADRLAAELGVSAPTIKRDGAYASALDTLEQYMPGLTEDAMAGQGPSRRDIIDVAREPERAAERLAHVRYNSGNNEWYTPVEYIQSARAVMGDIDLDPASCGAANAVIGAARYYTADDDGLLYEWTGRVWMNPPYAQPLVRQFCDKMADSVRSGSVTTAIVLVNNATETQWFQNIASVASAVCFPNGRVSFWSPDRKTAHPLQGQAVLYIGPDRPRFCEEFRRYGLVLCNEI